jgi:hypothetical protein
MKIELPTNKLYTDDGRFLKTIHCPKDMEWQDLEPQQQSTHRNCAHCECTVHDTTGMTDEDLVQLLEKDPQACLSISLAQRNCTIVPDRIDI